MKQIPKQQAGETPEEFTTRIQAQIRLAQEQINRNKYYKELLDCKIAADRIVKVPIVFAGKEPFICL